MNQAPVPDIAVVVAARNMEHYIAATLDSVARQSVANHETIVIDDGSTDGTRAIIERLTLADHRLSIFDGPQLGVSAARNLGLARARAPVVIFLDADDLLVPDAAERLLNVLTENPDASASLGHHRRIAEDGAPLDPPAAGFQFPKGDTLAALLSKNFVVNGGALAVRTALARDAGGYCTGLSYGEDWEFWCRLALSGDFCFDEGPSLLLYRQRASGANYRARISPLALDVPCIDSLARNAALQERFGRRLPKLLRRRRIDIFWAGVRSEFTLGSSAKALALGLSGLALYPDSVLRPHLAARFLRSLFRS